MKTQITPTGLRWAAELVMKSVLIPPTFTYQISTEKLTRISDEYENWFPVSNSSHTLLCTVRLRNTREVTETKRTFRG